MSFSHEKLIVYQRILVFNSKVSLWLLSLTLISIQFFASGCKKQDVPLNEAAAWQWPVMGTLASLTVRGDAPDTALMLAKAALEEVNAQLSVFNPASNVGQLNVAAGMDVAIRLHPHTQHMLDVSIQYCRDSGGAFSPLVGPLMEAWGFFRGGEGRAIGVPSAEVIADAQRLCDLSRVERRDDGTARLLDVGMKLDFGAIAKGYGVDVAFERLLAANYTNVLVNLGGNMRAQGVPSPERKAWRIAIRDPRLTLADQPLGTVLLGEGRAIATSGSYEQYFEWEGKRYSHIMDPRTGFPVSDEVLQVTILAPTAMAADALSTTCFVLGAEAGMKYLARQPGCEALFVVSGGKGSFSVSMTEGFKAVFEASPPHTGAQKNDCKTD